MSVCRPNRHMCKLCSFKRTLACLVRLQVVAPIQTNWSIYYKILLIGATQSKMYPEILPNIVDWGDMKQNVFADVHLNCANNCAHVEGIISVYHTNAGLVVFFHVWQQSVYFASVISL